MSKLALVIILLFSFSMSLDAHAARKGSSGRKQTQPVDRQDPSENCPSYGCSDDPRSEDSSSSSDTYVPGRSETYEEGGDRDTGGDYINGMPY